MDRTCLMRVIRGLVFSKNVMAPCGVGFVLSGEPHVKPRNRIATSGKRSAQQLDSRSLTKRDLAKAQRIPCLSRVATLVQPTENGQSLYISVPNLGYGIALKAGTQALAMCWGSESCGCRGSRTLPAGGHNRRAPVLPLVVFTWSICFASCIGGCTCVRRPFWMIETSGYQR